MSAETLLEQTEASDDIIQQWPSLLIDKPDDVELPVVGSQTVVPREYLINVWIDLSAQHVSIAALKLLATNKTIISHYNADRAGNGGHPLRVSLLDPAIANLT